MMEAMIDFPKVYEALHSQQGTHMSVLWANWILNFT